MDFDTRHRMDEGVVSRMSKLLINKLLTGIYFPNFNVEQYKYNDRYELFVGTRVRKLFDDIWYDIPVTKWYTHDGLEDIDHPTLVNNILSEAYRCQLFYKIQPWMIDKEIVWRSAIQITEHERLQI